MGGPGSRSYSEHAGGRNKTAAIAVAGSGVPQRPETLSEAESKVWDSLVEITRGVTFEQDSLALAECSRLIVRQEAFHDALRNKPTDETLNRLSLAVGRSLSAALTQLGLTPRARQLLVVPRADEPEQDELERLMAERGD